MDGAEIPSYAQQETTIDTVGEWIAQTVCARWDAEGNPSVAVTMQLAPDGALLSAQLTKSSGDVGWDNAVLQAVRRSDPLPVAENGKAPPTITMTFRPKGCVPRLENEPARF